MDIAALEISVGVLPNGTGESSIKPDLEVIKPALLYGDQTVLYSPHLLMLHHLDKQRHSSGEDLLIHMHAFLAKHDEDSKYSDVREILHVVEEIKSKSSCTTEEEYILESFSRIPQRTKEEYQKTIQPALDKHLSSIGYKQIRAAIKSGILSISPIVDGKTLDQPSSEGSDIINEYVKYVQMIVRKPGSYPLFDSLSVEIVRALVEDGRLPASVLGSARSKQVNLAAQLMRQAPTFPKADFYDIIDIRKSLKTPLIRFRSATLRLGQLIQSPVYGDEFEIEVADLVLRDIQPALYEIEEETRNNRYLKRLMYEATGSAGALVKSGLTVGMAMVTDLPLFISSIAGAASGIALAGKAAQLAATTYRNTHQISENIQRREMFFLSEMDRNLQARVGI